VTNANADNTTAEAIGILMGISDDEIDYIKIHYPVLSEHRRRARCDPQVLSMQPVCCAHAGASLARSSGINGALSINPTMNSYLMGMRAFAAYVFSGRIHRAALKAGA
jgi:hypothetical protein